MSREKMLQYLGVPVLWALLCAGSESWANFTGNGDGTITDSKTGLIWQQSGDGGSYNWEDALLYCENLDVAAYSDWRLPNYRELQSLVDYDRNNPALDTTYFPDGRSDYYWSGNTHVINGQYAWSVFFGTGIVDNNSKNNAYSARCVRGGPPFRGFGVLAVSKSGNGTGTILSEPEGIGCGADCTQEYRNGTTVLLTAEADAGSVFDGWSVGSCTGTGSCTIAMKGDTAVTASFKRVTFYLSGKVKTKQDAPLPGVSIVLSGVFQGTAVTSDAGQYVFPSIPAGGYTLTPNKSNYSFFPASLSMNVNGSDVDGLDFTGTRDGPDLVMAGVSGPVRAKPGETIIITSWGRNQGKMVASSFTVGLYLSTDVSIGETDQFLGSYNITFLNAGSTLKTASKITLPASILPGKYYLGAIADTQNNVEELNEKNNRSASLRNILVSE